MENFEIIGIVTGLAVTLPILIVGIVLVVMGKVRRNKVNQEPGYDGCTTGTVIGATRKSRRIYRSVISFTEICYQYSVNGMNYEGMQNDMRPLKGKRRWSRKAAQEAVDEMYPVGQQLTVYYRTDEPDKSYLLEDQYKQANHVQDKSMTISGWVLIGVFLFVILFFGGMFLMFTEF